jgi:pimeloyl-[acyl-carrier protein] methyl ester esterase
MRLHVETSGAGPDLALIHGWGMHGGIWDAVAQELARDFTLQVVDLPGHGRSAMRRPYGLDDLARDLLESVPGAASLCGWSLGAQVAMRAALLAPRRVDRLVLVSATPCFARRPDWPWGMDREVLEGFASDLKRDYEGTLRRFLALQARGGDAARAIAAALRARLFEHGRPDPVALESALALLLDGDLRPLVPGISQPVLLLHGEQDLLASAGAARWMAQRLPRARLVTLPRCAHAPFLSHPAQFARALREFLPGSRDG